MKLPEKGNDVITVVQKEENSRYTETKMHITGWRNNGYLNFPLLGHLRLLIFLQ